MKLVIVTATILALVHARPETYRENEEFQYSRSSSDDGSKSGYYGAQRGNTGGNYEKAHNMDPLAQHQMSSVVRQVDGELGSGADTKTGSVFTGGSSRGIYGSGTYDLSNLRGRNFAEGVSHSDSLSSFSQNSGYRGESYSANNARYRNQQSLLSSQNVGYRGVGDRASYVTDQREDDLQHSSSNQEYSNQAANNNYRYNQASSQGSSSYGQSIVDSNAVSSASTAGGSRRFTAPVKFYIRPGTRTTIPVTVHAYDATQYDSSHALTEQNQERYDDSELSFKPKHYESSYSYKKEWEKHDTQPLAVIPTENPFPKHSELYDNTQNLQQSSQKSDSEYQGYSANARYSNSRKSAFQSAYKAEGQHLAAGSNAQAYTADNRETKNTGEISSLIGDVDSKPKSYQSSYSYHKSWERRGDPYVIIPADSSQTAQRLTAATDKFGQRLTHQHGSHYNYAKQGYAEDCDCDENGHIRVARSYDENEYQNFQQQNQDMFDLGQQPNQWSNLEDLGQQTQNKWENFDNLGQETQNNWNQLGNLDQNTHNTESDNLRQTNQNAQSNLEDLGQQTQNKWDNLEDLSSQQKQIINNLENLGQQTQNKWDNLEDLGQQSQSKWDDLESLSQQHQQNSDNLANLGQQTQNKWDQLEDLTQQLQNHNEQVGNLGQQTQSVWDNLESLNHQSPSNLDTVNLEQQSQNTQFNWPFEHNSHHTQQDWTQQDANTHHQHQVTLNSLQNTHHQYQHQQNFNSWKTERNSDQFTGTSVQDEKTTNDNGYTNFWDNFDREKSFQFGTDTYQTNRNTNSDSLNSHQFNSSPQNARESPLNSLWNKIDNIAGIVQGNMDNKYNYSDLNNQDSSKYWNDQNHTNIWDVLQNENTEQKNEFDYHSTQNVIKPDTNTDESNNAEPETHSGDDHVITQNTDFILNESFPNEHIIHPIDVGRGDIDSEDTPTESSHDTSSLDKLFENIPSTLNKYKSPQEIESLSFKKEKSENSKEEVNSFDGTDEFSVLGLEQSMHDHNIQQQTSTYTNLITSTETTTSTEIYSDKIKPNRPALDSVSQSEARTNVQSENSHTSTETDDIIEQQFINRPPENWGQHYQNSENYEQNQQETQQFEQINNFGSLQNEQQQNQDLDNFPTNIDFQTTQNFNEQETQNTWDLGNNYQPINYEEEKKQRAPQVESIKKQDQIFVPVEVITEKPGFWKAFGNKLTNAKESVVSWFKS